MHVKCDSWRGRNWTGKFTRIYLLKRLVKWTVGYWELSVYLDYLLVFFLECPTLYIVPLLTSSIFTYISVLFLLTYNAFQGFILFLLVTVLNSDLRNHWKKLLCGCIKKKRQASSRQDKLREHAINRMNKTSKMAQGISESQHQDENMEELHDTDTHTSHNIVKNTNTLHVNMLDHH